MTATAAFTALHFGASLAFHHNVSFHSISTSFSQFRISSNTLRTSKFSRKSSALTAAEPLQKHLDEDEDSEFDDKVRPFVEQLADIDVYKEMRSFASPELEIGELEELPEQWRRSKIAWLCKELPSYKHSTFVRILNAQRKWITQEDATYVAVHCMRIRENEASYRVYKWMSQQHWFHFNFALATKLADFLGKDNKIAKCRELFDDIINQGHIPSESTFHILTVAYLSAPVDGSLEEACGIYNKMIQLGGYRPRLSLHNSLFRAIISKNGGVARHFLNQAEFIYHNIVTCDLEVHKDIFVGLIWLHGHQDAIDKERIACLRKEMTDAGYDDGDVMMSILRACAKDGDVEGAEKAWAKLLNVGGCPPSQAFVYRMDLYAKVGKPMKSLEIFNGMKQVMPVTAHAYRKIIEVMSGAHEVEVSEAILREFIESGMKPLAPAFRDVMSLYLNLGMHDKLEDAFSKCLTCCHPNRSIFNIYLESLVKIGNIDKADEIFNEMHSNGTIGSNACSCNTILEGYLNAGDSVKAEKVYNLMRLKRYDINPQSLEKLQEVTSQTRKVVKRRESMKLDNEQREILVGLLLGGLQIESDGESRNFAINFEFNESSDIHSLLKVHIHERFYEWLTSVSRSADDHNEIPFRFCTTMHSYFGFFAEQFRKNGQVTIPKLIHRWMSARVLAYWYMYGGFQMSSGDILLKLKGGNSEDIERIVKGFQAHSLACRMKRKGRTTWFGFQGKYAELFWKITEPYILDGIKDVLAPSHALETQVAEEDQLSDMETQRVEESDHMDMILVDK